MPVNTSLNLIMHFILVRALTNVGKRALELNLLTYFILVKALTSAGKHAEITDLILLEMHFDSFNRGQCLMPI